MSISRVRLSLTLAGTRTRRLLAVTRSPRERCVRCVPWPARTQVPNLGDGEPFLAIDERELNAERFGEPCKGVFGGIA